MRNILNLMYILLFYFIMDWLILIELCVLLSQPAIEITKNGEIFKEKEKEEWRAGPKTISFEELHIMAFVHIPGLTDSRAEAVGKFIPVRLFARARVRSRPTVPIIYEYRCAFFPLYLLGGTSGLVDLSRS